MTLNINLDDHNKYLDEIVIQFNSNKNFTLQDYLSLMYKTNYKHNFNLLTKKVFNSFKIKMYITKQDIIDYQNKNPNNRSKQLMDIQSTDNQKITLYCDSHSDDKICTCYSTTQNIINLYNTEVDKTDKKNKQIDTENEDEKKKYYDSYNKDKDNKKNTLTNFRYTVGQNIFSEGTLDAFSPCCVSNDANRCSCPSGMVFIGNGYNENDFDGTWGTDCWSTCKYTDAEINNQLLNWSQQYLSDNPLKQTPRELAPSIDANIQCCINDIKDINTATNVSQTCNQYLLSYIDSKTKNTNTSPTTPTSDTSTPTNDTSQDTYKSKKKSIAILIILVFICLCVLLYFLFKKN
jgi:hypothetical protein